MCPQIFAEHMLQWSKNDSKIAKIVHYKIVIETQCLCTNECLRMTGNSWLKEVSKLKQN